MYDKIPTTLMPEAVSFDLPTFIERHEILLKQVMEDGKLINQKSQDLHKSYLKFQDLLVRKS